MALIFLGVITVFTVSSLSLSNSGCLDFIADDEWPQFTKAQSTGLSDVGQC